MKAKTDARGHLKFKLNNAKVHIFFIIREQKCIVHKK